MFGALLEHFKFKAGQDKFLVYGKIFRVIFSVLWQHILLKHIDSQKQKKTKKLLRLLKKNAKKQ